MQVPVTGDVLQKVLVKYLGEAASPSGLERLAKNLDKLTWADIEEAVTYTTQKHKGTGYCLAILERLAKTKTGGLETDEFLGVKERTESEEEPAITTQAESQDELSAWYAEQRRANGTLGMRFNSDAPAANENSWAARHDPRYEAFYRLYPEEGLGTWVPLGYRIREGVV
jgi:hypothetical protein